MTDRQYDIVLFGASGFTGELVAEYLAANVSGIRWAIAGRSASKLEAVRERIGQPDLAILVADSDDAAALTALSNDEGYDQVFAKQIEYFGAQGDMLVAISSSGNSDNIVKAVRAARAKGCSVLTFSGLGADNKLRQMGDYNLYVPSGEYGFVEVVHGGLIHALLDIFMGWSAQSGLWNKSVETPVKERGVA